jgi:probable HAF family extracellular repeat protein
MKNVLGAVAMVAVMAAAGMAEANNGGYTFTELGTLDGGWSRPLAINDSGQIVGFTDTSGGGSYTAATVWNGTSPTNLFSWGKSGYATDINNSGQIVGYTLGYNSFSEAILWNNGLSTTLGPYPSSAYTINNAGQIAGNTLSGSTVFPVVWNGTNSQTYLNIGGLAHGINDTGQVLGYVGSTPFIWNGTTTTLLGTLSGNYGRGSAINNAGQVVGYSTIEGGNSHATLWNNTTAIDLGTLGGVYSYAHNINSSGQIVGDAMTTDSTFHAFLWDGTSMLDLNNLIDSKVVSDGWTLISAMDININGLIVGDAINSITGQRRAYLLTPDATPTPIPAAAWLFGSGLMGLVGLRRKNRKV